MITLFLSSACSQKLHWTRVIFFTFPYHVHHGVTKTKYRGIHRYILQTELQNIRLADEQRNTVKVAILGGNSIIQDCY